jgi:hypothetical protein
MTEQNNTKVIIRIIPTFARGKSSEQDNICYKWLD